MKEIKLNFIHLLTVIMLIQPIKAQLNNPNNIDHKWNTDFSISNVNLNEITVVLPRNSFPPINYPTFTNREKGLENFFENEPVISVEIDGKAKAYPLSMLTMHEITNDTLNGVPILATYCPLCNSSIVFNRRLIFNGKQYLFEFEVSGMLRKSDMVMGDKQTETLWQQLTGTGIVGNLTGAEMEIIPSLVISIKDFFLRFPDGKILNPDTGTNMEEYYNTNPYQNYDRITGKPYNRYFNHKNIDYRLPPMERVISIEENFEHKIYPYSEIIDEEVINDSFNGKDIVIFYKKGMVSNLDREMIRNSRDIGSATAFSPILDEELLLFQYIDGKIQDQKTNSSWDITGLCTDGPLKGKILSPIKYSNHFAFAWLSFHPESEIYENDY